MRVTTATVAPPVAAPVRPRLRRIRVEIEQEDGSVRTTLLTAVPVWDGESWRVEAADMDANVVRVLSDEEAARWLKRLRKRGIT